MKQLTKNELLHWLERYNKEEDLYNTGLEEELRNKFQKYRFMTKDDLLRIVEWKFQGRLKGRQIRIKNLLGSVEDDFIQNVSTLAFQTEDDRTRLSLLSSIRGVGNALSSVILAFFNPKRYGVLDIHDWREIYDKKQGEEPPDLFLNHKRAIDFFQKLREISYGTGLCCRDVEKALFKKNLEES